MISKLKWAILSVAGVAIVSGGAIAIGQTLGTNVLKTFDWVVPKLQPMPQKAKLAKAQVREAAAQSTKKPAESAPQRTETIRYGSWVVTCNDTMEKGSRKVCSAVLRVITQKKQVLLVWVIGHDDKGLLRTVLRTPTGVMIQKGVELKLGKSKARELPYTVCTPQQCEASTAMDNAMIRDAYASTKAVVSISAVNGRKINFNVSIDGISKVLAALR
jgi:invasion protein IalB